MNRMSNDLIDRKMLIRYLTISVDGRRILEYDIDNFPTTIPIKDMKEIIRNQPAAFDKEKVIEEIRKQVGTCKCEHCEEYVDCDACRAEEAVKIVEKGGIE